MDFNVNYWSGLAIMYGLKIIFALVIFFVGRWLSKWLAEPYPQMDIHQK